MLKNFPFATINGVSSPGSATMSEAIMHVACAADENYIPHCATMLVSLFDRHDPACIHVHFLHSAGFPVKVLQQLGSMVQRHGAQISLHSIAEESTAGLPSIKDVAPVMWHKVLLPDLLPQLDKVLYLDTDIVITDELWPLWDTDFRGVSLAAVSNVMVPDQWGYPGRLGVAYADYFNTGVLLLNLQKMRGTDDARKILDASRGKDYVYWDQDALNIFYAGQQLRLHPRWNCMNSLFLMEHAKEVFGAKNVDDACANPAVVHFEGRALAKPWHYLSKHPYRDIYLKYRARTPWPLTELEGVTFKNRLLRPLPMRAMFFLLNAEYQFKARLAHRLRRLGVLQYLKKLLRFKAN